jgi:hypothetical protein
MPFRLAVIVAGPLETPIAMPLEFIVAIEAWLDVQVAVALTSAVVLSLYCAVAVNCCVAAGAMVAVDGATDTEASVFAPFPVPLDGLPPQPKVETRGATIK